MKLPKWTFHASRDTKIKAGILCALLIIAVVTVAVDTKRQSANAVWRKMHAVQLAPLLQAKHGDLFVFKDGSMCLIGVVRGAYMPCMNSDGKVEDIYLEPSDSNLLRFDHTVPANGDPQAWNVAMKKFHGIPQ